MHACRLPMNDLGPRSLETVSVRLEADPARNVHRDERDVAVDARMSPRILAVLRFESDMM